MNTIVPIKDRHQYKIILEHYICNRVKVRRGTVLLPFQSGYAINLLNIDIQKQARLKPYYD
jgi:hypothetical protein